MPTFADIILSENESAVREALRYHPEINVIDEYGFTPLIEAAIVNQTSIADLLMRAGADVNLRDMLGATPLHWAAENNNVAMARMFLDKGANPNAWNISGQPVGVLPVLRRQNEMKLLLEQRGANLGFIQDYVNTKMLGHLFELLGAGSILAPDGELVEVSFEGFLPEVTLAMIVESLHEFQNHFASRTVRRYSAVTDAITMALERAARLIRFQQYRVNVGEHQPEILSLLGAEPLVIPVSYEGHAITFIRHGNFLVKCDRREDSRLFDNIVIFRMKRPDRMNAAFVQKMIYRKQSDVSINQLLPEWLELEPETNIHIPAQISGNCSWANVEACIPALFYLLSKGDFSKQSSGDGEKHQALNYFQQWREWNRERALQFCLHRFRTAGPLRQATIAETLAAILFQACSSGTARENERAERIIETLANSPSRYVLKNYVQVWAYEDHGPEGKQFIRLLQRSGFDPGK